MTKRPIRSNYDLQVDMARSIFLQYEQQTMIRKFRLQADETWIFLEYLHTPCRIHRTDGRVEELTDGIWRECRSFNTVMTIYDLLCYHRGEQPPILSGDWCTVGSFVVTGFQDAGEFTGKYAAMFQGHAKELEQACRELGGEICPRVAGADVTCRFAVTPFFPLQLQFWDGDEEFPPRIRLLWDKNSDRFLHFETTFYLQGDLLERLHHINASP